MSGWSGWQSSKPPAALGSQLAFTADLRVRVHKLTGGCLVNTLSTGAVAAQAMMVCKALEDSIMEGQAITHHYLQVRQACCCIMQGQATGSDVQPATQSSSRLCRCVVWLALHMEAACWASCCGPAAPVSGHQLLCS